jgi:hypothetical protein
MCVVHTLFVLQQRKLVAEEKEKKTARAVKITLHIYQEKGASFVPGTKVTGFTGFTKVTMGGRVRAFNQDVWLINADWSQLPAINKS